MPSKKPRTEKQIAASRANGAKSRGPVSPDGKSHSCLNGLKHGLVARTVVLDGESRQRFEALSQALNEELLPETPLEQLLITKMAVAHWRQMRVWGMEKAKISREMSADTAPDAPTRDATALLDQARSWVLMSRYEAGCDRQFSRALDRFLKLRAVRSAQNIFSEERT